VCCVQSIDRRSVGCLDLGPRNTSRFVRRGEPPFVAFLFVPRKPSGRLLDDVGVSELVGELLDLGVFVMRVLHDEKQNVGHGRFGGDLAHPCSPFDTPSPTVVAAPITAFPALDHDVANDLGRRPAYFRPDPRLPVVLRRADEVYLITENASLSPHGGEGGKIVRGQTWTLAFANARRSGWESMSVSVGSISLVDFIV